MPDTDDLNFLIEEQHRPANEDVYLDETSDFVIEPPQQDILAPTQNIPVQTQAVSVDLNKDKFSAFMSVLQMMKYSCQDLYIRNGKISQINSKKSMFFEIDLTPILGDANLVIGGITSKFDILSMFKKQGVDVFLDISSTGYTFRDAQSKIHNKRPIESFLEQTSMTTQQIQDRIQIDTNRRIFSYVWQKRMLDRIMGFAKSLATPVIRVECLGDTIVCKTQSLDNASTTQIDLLTLEDEVDDSSLVDVVTPFPSMCFINFIQGGIVEISSELYHRVYAAGERPSSALRLSGSLPVAGVDRPISVVISSSGWFSPLHGNADGNII